MSDMGELYPPKDLHSGKEMSNEIHLHIWKTTRLIKNIPYLSEPKMNLLSVQALYLCKTRAHTLPAVELIWSNVHVDMYAHDDSFHSFLAKNWLTNLKECSKQVDSLVGSWRVLNNI
jgi:hypothetical protein